MGGSLPVFQITPVAGAISSDHCYLFTEWKCNLDCHYCWAFDNTVKGMTEVVAKDQSTGALDHLPRSGLYGRRATVAASIGPQGFLLCRQERLLDIHANKRAAAAARCD